MRMLRRVACLGLLLLLAPVQGGVVLEQTSTVSPATATPPATLASLSPNTVIGGSGTSATTSSPIRLTGLPASALKVVHGTVPQDVHITVTGRSGFTMPSDSVTVTLGSASVVVTQTSSLPQSSAIVDLGTTSDLTVTAAGVCKDICTLAVDFRIEPDGAAVNPTTVYPWTLAVT
jgi:hypothetical protein